MAKTFDDLSARWGATGRYWRRQAILWGGVLLVLLIAFLMMWNSFFVYVPPAHHLVIIAKEGEPLPSGEVLAEAGQKGILREVKGEGWHFVLPIFYETSVEPNTDIPAGKLGIVTARGGKRLLAGRILADEGEQGIQRKLLLPGSYRLNRKGYDVELVNATTITLGHVGVLRRLLGRDGKTRFAESPEEKGILRQILQPGLYYIHTKEYKVIEEEVGISQTSFHHDADPAKSTAITFTSKGGFQISLDCTIEWEILPKDMPSLIAEYGTWKNVERNVIDVQAHAIGRDKGVDYGVQNFLEGSKREEFQNDFRDELIKVCQAKDVTIRSAFIRNIVIPETYLKPIRDKQIAAETEITNKAKEATAQSEAEVEREEKMIAQRSAEVAAETARMVAGTEREVENIATRTQAEIEKLKAEYGAKIAGLEAQRTQVLGEASAEASKLKQTAENELYKLKMEVFQNQGDAFLKASLAESLNPNMVLRLFHSGPGTFWTNLDSKGMNFMLPIGGSEPAKNPPPAAKPGLR